MNHGIKGGRRKNLLSTDMSANAERVPMPFFPLCPQNRGGEGGSAGFRIHLQKVGFSSFSDSLHKKINLNL